MNSPEPVPLIVRLAFIDSVSRKMQHKVQTVIDHDPLTRPDKRTRLTTPTATGKHHEDYEGSRLARWGPWPSGMR